MQITTTPFEGLLILEPRVFRDDRGNFRQSFQRQQYREAGIQEEFVQDNLVYSGKGVLRGLHFQFPHPQGKLIYAITGAIVDAVVDLRHKKTTYGRSYTIELSEKNGRQLYVPPGFAHGYYTLSETVIVAYKCTDYYHPECEQGLRWNDPALQIDWPEECPRVAERDQNFPTLKDLPFFDFDPARN